jgi:hypothetical protein
MSAQTRIDMGCYSRSGFLLGHPGGHIYFYPWEGKNFRQNKLRLLILGESHYGKSNETRDFTWRLTDEIIKGEIRGRFWTQIAQAITGRSRWEINRAQFWNSVSFYNYVQQIVADKARVAPTPEMFHRSEPAFFETIDFLRPTHLLAMGYRLWSRMPALANEGLHFSIDGKRYQYGEYRRDWGRVLAMSIKHPSSAFSAPVWHPVIKRFLCSNWPETLDNEL